LDVDSPTHNPVFYGEQIMAELELIATAEAKETFLVQRRDEVAEGEKLDDRRTESLLYTCDQLGVYDESRYFVLTRDLYEVLTPVESRPTVLQEVQDDYLPKRQRFSFTGQQKPMSQQEFDRGQTDATPETVVRRYRPTSRWTATNLAERYSACGGGAMKGDRVHRRRIWPS
jgi:hypothetical protein